jgi:hypothetical protein
MSRSKPHSVEEVLSEVFRRGRMRRGVRRAEAVLLWPQVAGPEVAKFTAAKSLQDGILFVEVSDSETAMHLSLQRQRFLDVYHGKFGIKEVRELRFRVGYRPPPSPPAAKPAAAPVDPKALAELTRTLGALELPDALAGPAMRLAKAMLAYRARREAEGWKPCPTCESLCDTGGLCHSCQRYYESPRVRRAAELLAVDPERDTPLLSPEERQVAVHLAKEHLTLRLQELLPQVLAEPRFKAQLESAARCYLAHVLGKPLDAVADEDFDRLEPRVARALGRWG